MNQVIIDTDTISFFFRKHDTVVKKMNDQLSNFGFINISVVTYYEILNGLFFKDAKSQLNSFENFITLNEIVPLDEKIAQKAAKIFAELRKNGQIIGHNDVLIAATALIHDFTLISNNVNHFNRIEGLKVENWAK